jgi:hypothetical protein
MDNLIKRYEDKTTSEGHKLDVKEKSDVITAGFRHSGEYQDEYDPYIKVLYFPRFSSLSCGQAEQPLGDGLNFLLGDPGA